MPKNYKFNKIHTVISLPLFFVLSAHPTMADDKDIETIEVHGEWQPYRGNIPLTKTPQAVVSINASDLENSGITRFQEALDFSSSVVRQNTSGCMWDSFAIRGVAGDENNAAGLMKNIFQVHITNFGQCRALL